MFLGKDLERFFKKSVFKNFKKKTQKNICAGVLGLYLIKIQAGACNFITKRPHYGGFFVNSAKFFKKLILETSVNGCF